MYFNNKTSKRARKSSYFVAALVCSLQMSINYNNYNSNNNNNNNNTFLVEAKSADPYPFPEEYTTNCLCYEWRPVSSCDKDCGGGHKLWRRKCETAKGAEGKCTKKIRRRKA